MATKDKAAQVLEAAQESAKTAKSWVDIHNAVYGLGGIATRLFPGESDRVAYSKTDEYKQVQQIIEQARESLGDPAPLAKKVESAKGNISIRMPASIHAALLAEAEAENVSLNQLCLVKLCVQLRAVI